jgi:hypothetical protein
VRRPSDEAFETGQAELRRVASGGSNAGDRHGAGDAHRGLPRPERVDEALAAERSPAVAAKVFGFLEGMPTASIPHELPRPPRLSESGHQFGRSEGYLNANLIGQGL